MKMNRVTPVIYLHTLLGMHMGMSRRNGVVSHVEPCAGKGLYRDEFGVVIAACGQNQRMGQSHPPSLKNKWWVEKGRSIVEIESCSR